jgi:hypothetical protein
MAIRQDRTWLALDKIPREGRAQRTFRLPATARGFSVTVPRDGLPSVDTSEVLRLTLEYSTDDGTTWNLIVGCGVGGGPPLSPASGPPGVSIQLLDTIHFKENGVDFYETWSRELPPSTLLRLTTEYLIPLDCECQVHLEEGPRQLKKRDRLHRSVAFDAASSAQGTVTSLTFSHTCTGSDRGLIAAISQFPVRTMAVTYNSVSMTSEGQRDNGAGKEVEQFSLIAPATGANNIAFTWGGGSSEVIAGGVSVTGADQTDLARAQVSAFGNSGTATVNATSDTDEFVIDAFVADANDFSTVGADQTERWNLVEGSTSGGGSTEPGAASVTMSWALPFTTDWGIVALSINPVAAAATAVLTGTATETIDEADIVAGGKTIIVTLTDDTFVPAAGIGDTPVFSTGTAKSITTAPGRTGDGDLTISFPPSYTPAAGDFALIVLYHDQGTGSVPDGWSEITGSPWGSGTPKLQAFYKVLVGDESDPVTTISGSGTNISHCANMAIYPLGGSIGAVGTASEGTGSPMTAGAITTTSNNAVVLGLCGRGDNESASGQTFDASGTGVTEQLDGGTGAGFDSQVSMYDKAFPTSGTSSGNGSATTNATDPWVSVLIEIKPKATTPFSDARQAFIDGFDSAQSEGTGWDAEVKAKAAVTEVVRTSDTVVTWTLGAQAGYNITAQEVITGTIPGSILTGGSPIVATPTFTIDPVAGAALLAIRNESGEVAEAQLRNLGMARLRSETAEVAEAALRFLGLRRLLSETAEIAEDRQRNLGLLRLNAETGEIAEDRQRNIGMLRLRSETGEIAEASARVVGLRRVLSETVNIAEAVVSRLGLLRLHAETAEISEARLNLLGFIRLRAETVEIAEAVLRFLGLQQLQNETAELAETSPRFLGLRRLRDETAQAVETALRNLGLRRVHDEDSEIAEQRLRFVGLRRVRDETVEILEAVLRWLGLTRARDESVQAPETSDFIRGLTAAVAETVAVAEAIINRVILSVFGVIAATLRVYAALDGALRAVPALSVLVRNKPALEAKLKLEPKE